MLVEEVNASATVTGQSAPVHIQGSMNRDFMHSDQDNGIPPGGLLSVPVIEEDVNTRDRRDLNMNTSHSSSQGMGVGSHKHSSKDRENSTKHIISRSKAIPGSRMIGTSFRYVCEAIKMTICGWNEQTKHSEVKYRDDVSFQPTLHPKIKAFWMRRSDQGLLCTPPYIDYMLKPFLARSLKEVGVLFEQASFVLQSGSIPNAELGGGLGMGLGVSSSLLSDYMIDQDSFVQQTRDELPVTRYVRSNHYLKLSRIFKTHIIQSEGKLIFVFNCVILYCASRTISSKHIPHTHMFLLFYYTQSQRNEQPLLRFNDHLARAKPKGRAGHSRQSDA
jgi:hypothetical protein